MYMTIKARMKTAIAQAGEPSDKEIARLVTDLIRNKKAKDHSVPAQTIQKIRTEGTRSFYITHIAVALGVSPMWLAEGVGEMQVPALPRSTKEKPLSKTERRMLNLWRGWSPIVKQYVFGQMRLADMTRDLISDAFKVNGKLITHNQVDADVVNHVSEDGQFLS